jgi:hypothetical protein
MVMRKESDPQSVRPVSLQAEFNILGSSIFGVLPMSLPQLLTKRKRKGLLTL